MVLAVLLVPVHSGTLNDGGIEVYSALTYKIVDWNRIDPGTELDETRVYVFPNNFKSISQLWEMELAQIEEHFLARVLECSDSWVLVEPLAGEDELRSSDQISFGTGKLEDIGAQVGSVVEITYDGMIMESYPAQISPKSWRIATDLRSINYSGQWLDESSECGNDLFQDVVISQLYADCFIAEPYFPSPYRIKVNTATPLSQQWCVGDQVRCTFQNSRWNEEQLRIETELVTIEESTLELEPGMDYKPVIYLYPTEETKVSVTLELDGKLTCTYPAYREGWTVTAAPDGTLTDEQGQTYNYLYWEGTSYARYNFSRGFCVKGEDTAAFLEDALAKLGLNRREANEFIVYWLPLMQDNPYNIISFQTDRYTDAAKLTASPAPDTAIRVFMAWQASQQPVELPPQELTAPERTGFTLVEWGGTEVK